jgi:hypothetical protein
MPTETKLLYNRRTLTDRDAFAYYREHSKLRTLSTTPRMESHSKIIRAFYKEIADSMVESSNGVFLQGFGYFVNLMNPIKSVVAFKRSWVKKDLYLNPHTKGRVFHPTFLHICNNFKFRFFIMDRTFNRTLKTKLKQQLVAKKKYFNNYGILNSLYKNKK